MTVYAVKPDTRTVGSTALSLGAGRVQKAFTAGAQSALCPEEFRCGTGGFNWQVGRLRFYLRGACVDCALRYACAGWLGFSGWVRSSSPSVTISFRCLSTNLATSKSRISASSAGRQGRSSVNSRIAWRSLALRGRDPSGDTARCIAASSPPPGPQGAGPLGRPSSREAPAIGLPFLLPPRSNWPIPQRADSAVRDP